MLARHRSIGQCQCAGPASAAFARSCHGCAPAGQQQSVRRSGRQGRVRRISSILRVDGRRRARWRAGLRVSRAAQRAARQVSLLPSRGASLRYAPVSGFRSSVHPDRIRWSNHLQSCQRNCDAYRESWRYLPRPHRRARIASGFRPLPSSSRCACAGLAAAVVSVRLAGSAPPESVPSMRSGFGIFLPRTELSGAMRPGRRRTARPAGDASFVGAERPAHSVAGNVIPLGSIRCMVVSDQKTSARGGPLCTN